jgi:hypothetical protein
MPKTEFDKNFEEYQTVLDSEFFKEFPELNEFLSVSFGGNSNFNHKL